MKSSCVGEAVMPKASARAVRPASELWCVLHGVAQGLLGMLMFPPSLQLWARVTSLYYDAVQARYGLEAAVFTVCTLTLLTFQVVAVVLTIPALVGQKQGKIQENKETSVREVLRMVPLLAFNFCIGVVVLAETCLLATPRDRLVHLTGDLPSWSTLWTYGLVFFAMGDIWTFYVHKWLHWGIWYDQVHKLHHTWTAPVALEATYQHPLEFVAMQLGGCMVGSLALGLLSGDGMQAAPMLCWTVMGFIQCAGGHSGYWGSDFGIHDLHHERFIYNFSVSGLPDLLYGTLRVRSPAPAERLQ